jgi:hypothetical protein
VYEIIIPTNGGNDFSWYYRELEPFPEIERGFLSAMKTGKPKTKNHELIYTVGVVGLIPCSGKKSHNKFPGWIIP